MIDFSLISEIQKLAKNTDAKVAKAIRRYKLDTSTDETVLIDINQTGELDYTITFNFRASLKMQDMGSGRGFRKGVRINQENYSLLLEKNKVGRRQKRLVNRKIYWMINSLREVGATAIVEQTLSSFTLTLSAENVNHQRTN